MARGKSIGKALLLVVLIIILCLLGLLWFDYLGVVQAKKVFAPLYKLFGLSPQTSYAVASTDPLEEADIDNDRFAKRLESLNLRSEELDKREEDVKKIETENAQVAAELEDRQKSQEEREKTFNSEVKKYDDRKVNIVQIAKNLQGMQPNKSVAILLAMDDQDVIDVLRETEEEAKAAGTSSMVAYWLSLMPAERAATIQRKMASKPVGDEVDSGQADTSAADGQTQTAAQ